MHGIIEVRKYSATAFAYRQDAKSDIDKHRAGTESRSRLGVVAIHKIGNNPIQQSNSRVDYDFYNKVGHVVSGSRVQLRPGLSCVELTE